MSWDKDETQKLVDLGLSWEHARIAVGRIAEHRQQAYCEGQERGFTNGYEEGQKVGPKKLKLAQVFHPCVFLAEEIDSRGWSEEQFLKRCAVYGDAAVDVDIIRMILRGETAVISERVASILACVFGVSYRLFLNLTATYLESLRDKT